MRAACTPNSCTISVNATRWVRIEADAASVFVAASRNDSSRSAASSRTTCGRMWQACRSIIEFHLTRCHPRPLILTCRRLGEFVRASGEKSPVWVSSRDLSARPRFVSTPMDERRPMDTMESYRRAQDLLDEVLGAVREGQWDGPSACAEWSVRDVAGHVIWGQRQLRAWATGAEYTD